MKRKSFYPAVAAAALAVVGGLFALILPRPVISGNAEKNLDILRNKARLIQRSYAALASEQEQTLDRLTRGSFPKTAAEQFSLFKSIGLDPETEGVALYDSAKKLRLWLGRAVNLETVFSGTSPPLTPSFRPKQIVVRDRASSVLSLLVRLESGDVLVMHHLLAFTPEFQSPYLDEYGFLPVRVRRNAVIDYWDFREDLSSFERLFSGHQDEFIATPRSPDEVPSLLFPLRTSEGRITATVNLRSPSPASRRLALREALAFSALAALAAALFLFLIGCLFVSAFFRDRRPESAAIFFFSLTAFRAVFFPLSRLGPAVSSPLFSPDRAGFASWGGLTRSPFEIFLTALTLFGLSAGLTHFLSGRAGSSRSRWTLWNISRLLCPPLLIAGCIWGIERLVFNSNIHLLRFVPTVPFFLLHAAIFLLLAATAVPAFVIVKKTFDHGRLPAWSIPAYAVVSALLLIAFRPSTPIRALIPAAALGFTAAGASLSKRQWRKAAAVFAVLAVSAGSYGSIRQATVAKSRALARGFLRETVETRDSWARFLLDESMRSLARSRRDIVRFLRQRPDSPDLARRLWNDTLAARFNWYSGLEIHDPEGTILSRFALNVPKIFRLTADLPLSAEGSVVRLPLPFMGKTEEFLIGYRDWVEDGDHLGRTILYVSLDDALLPFLYSANPYFELLRSNALPSLVQFDFHFAIFNAAGGIIFNPSRLSTGLPASLLRLPSLDGPGLWSELQDKGERFDLYAFRHKDRICAILTPQPTVIGLTVEYFKYAVLTAAFFALFLFGRWLVSAHRGRPRPLWSFADRVYISFTAVALVPLLLFAFFSPQFFKRVFAQQFIRKAEIHATLARNVMDDFIYLQREEDKDVETPPEDLVLWISATTANDVNLYRDGRLISSSRRELFDAGILPELLDGEIYFRIEFENHPYYAQTQRLGSFSYQTLTVPYTAVDPPLLLSLPFPFEQQEISAAGRELFEFLVFIGIFFVGIVLLLARGIGAMIVTPVRRLLAGTREAALGNLEFEVEYRGRDEMKTLVDGFNGMIRSLKNHQHEMADLGRKAAWADMARKVAHEVKNPLTPIQLSAEHLLHVWEDRRSDFEPALKESISYIVGEVENLRRLAQEFLDLSKSAVLNKQAVSLDDILAETVGPYRKLLSDRLTFVTSIEPGLRFEGDRGKLKIAFRNLMINAIESIRNQGEIRVEARRSGDRYLIVIADSGSGMDPEIAGRIFEPYFSTKLAGTGLGLPITKKIVEDHGGAIRIQSEPRRGTAVTIDLPAPSA
ncbi:MAG: HAMP domain-containing sensor histidine kinase [Candidatus Aminicenantes bacterium]|nr:HAMP domain-containing sensor histidine kinase [Candidatus Aminicenantes bacterium]